MSFGYRAEMALSRVRDAESSTVFYPNSPRVGTCGVILVPGASNPQQYVSPAQKSSVKLAAGLASVGIPCVTADMNGNNWASDPGILDVTNSWGLLQDEFPQMRTDKVCLLGASMGGAVVARWSQLFPEQTAAVVGLIPLWDLVAMYEANLLGYASQVATRWGVVAPAPLPASADIEANTHLAAGIPLLGGYSTTDTLINPQWVIDYAAEVGGIAQITNPDAGHTDASTGGISISQIAQFFVAAGA